MKSPKVSIIIPVYNGEKTLRECLDSVLNQTHKNYEVIAVDNNSIDKTKDIIKEFQKKNKKIRYLFEPKIGRGAARHKGEINAKSGIILITDSDCIVSKTWIKEMTKPIIKDKQIAVQGIKKPIVINYWTKHIQKEEEKLMRIRIKDKKIGLLDTANFAIKKSVLKDVGYTNPHLIYGEDTELMIKLKIKGYDIYFKKFPVLHYHPDTFSKVFKKFFKRGEWNQRIKKIYKSEKEIFPDESLFNHFSYLCGISLELLTFRKNFKYDFVTGIAWRAGGFYGWIKK